MCFSAAALNLPPEEEVSKSHPSSPSLQAEGDTFWNAWLSPESIASQNSSPKDKAASTGRGSISSKARRSPTFGQDTAMPSWAASSDVSSKDGSLQVDGDKLATRRSPVTSGLPVHTSRSPSPMVEKQAWMETSLECSSPTEESLTVSVSQKSDSKHESLQKKRGPMRLASKTGKKSVATDEKSMTEVPVIESKTESEIEKTCEMQKTEDITEEQDTSDNVLMVGTEDCADTASVLVNQSEQVPDISVDTVDSGSASKKTGAVVLLDSFSDVLSAASIPTAQPLDGAGVRAVAKPESDWKDLSLNILSESQLSTVSTVSKAESTDSHVLVEKTDVMEMSKSDTEGETENESQAVIVAESEGSTANQREAQSSPQVEVLDSTDKSEQPESSATSEDNNDGKTREQFSINMVKSSDIQTDGLPRDSILRVETTDSLTSSQTPDTERMDMSSETDQSESNKTLTADEFETAMSQSKESSASGDDNDDDAVTEKATMESTGQEMERTEKEDQVSLASQKESSRGNLSSSSYVKNMLEEAMVESLKDTDSRADSHSSSDMVRIESGQNSGHTSADEIETTTSSDIEIISHLSTPTSNGDYRIDFRTLDLSPLKYAFNRTNRRQSPPGHKRSDSGSSGYSLQSRNGDDVLSPDGSHSHTETGVTSAAAAACSKVAVVIEGVKEEGVLLFSFFI